MNNAVSIAITRSGSTSSSWNATKYFLTFFCLVYGSLSITPTPLEFSVLTETLAPVRLHELILMLLAFMGIVEILWTKRTPSFGGALGVAMAALGCAILISFLRTLASVEGWKLVYELHNLPSFVLSFFVYAILFTARDLKNLFRIIIGVALFKGIEGGIVFFLAGGAVGWSAMIGWREGFELTLGLIASALLATRRSVVLSRERRLALWALPLVLFSFVVSYRRSFIVAASLAAVITMVVSPSKYFRPALVKGFLFVGALTILTILVTGLELFTSHFSFLSDTSSEFSFYYRVMEYPNMWRNFLASPWIGHPFGFPWKVYYALPAYLSPLEVHNTFLYVVLRTGLVGLVCFVAVLSVAGKYSYEILRYARTERDVMLSHFLATSFLTFVIASFPSPMFTEGVPYISSLLLVMIVRQVARLGKSRYISH